MVDGAAVIESHPITTTLVASPVPCSLVRPSPALRAQLASRGGPATSVPSAPTGGSLPLVIALHGGNGARGFAQQMAALAGTAWTAGFLPPAVIAVPESGRSFWVDAIDGSARWESFLLDSFLTELRATAGVDPTPAATALIGVSMGGMGVLRLAFRNPELFAAVAALEPGIDPALRWADVDPNHNFLRNEKLYEQFFGSPVDAAFFEANHPPAMALANADRLRSSALSIYLECGDEDTLRLHEGAEFLHRLLWDNGILHEYHLVRGADHVGRSLPRRFIEAFGFLGRALRPDGPDPAVEQLRVWQGRAQKWQQRRGGAAGPRRRYGRPS